jgi:hypothetical protein
MQCHQNLLEAELTLNGWLELFRSPLIQGNPVLKGKVGQLIAKARVAVAKAKAALRRCLQTGIDCPRLDN